MILRNLVKNFCCFVHILTNEGYFNGKTAFLLNPTTIMTINGLSKLHF